MERLVHHRLHGGLALRQRPVARLGGHLLALELGAVELVHRGLRPVDFLLVDLCLGALGLESRAVPGHEVALGVAQVADAHVDDAVLVHQLRAVPGVNVALGVHELGLVDGNVAVLVDDGLRVVVLDGPHHLVDVAVEVACERGEVGGADAVERLGRHGGAGVRERAEVDVLLRERLLELAAHVLERGLDLARGADRRGGALVHRYAPPVEVADDGAGGAVVVLRQPCELVVAEARQLLGVDAELRERAGDGGQGLHVEALILQGLHHQLAPPVLLGGNGVKLFEFLGAVAQGLVKEQVLVLIDADLGGRGAGVDDQNSVRHGNFPPVIFLNCSVKSSLITTLLYYTTVGQAM